MHPLTSTPRFGKIVHIPDFEAALAPENPVTLARCGALRQQCFAQYGSVVPGVTSNANGGQEIILLTENDAKQFLRNHYNVAFPQNLQNKSMDEFYRFVEQNPQQYPDVIAFHQQLEAENRRDPWGGLFKRVRDYFLARQNTGTDVDGNPIEVITG